MMESRSPSACSPARVPVPVPVHSQVLGALESHARARPDARAVAGVGADGAPLSTMTFGALAGAVTRLAGVLSGTAAPGDTVLLMGPGGPAFVAWLLAAISAGVRVLPVHPRSAPAEVVDLAERSGAAVIVASEGAPAPPALRAIPFASAGDSGPAIATNGDRSPAPDRGRCGAGAIVLVSSATTGRSKLVLRESPALDADAANVARAAALAPGECVLLGVPTTHSYGVDFVLASVFAGAELLVLDPFDGGAASDALTRYTTVLPAVPFMLEALARVPPPCGPGRLRLAISAGSPLPREVGVAFERAWGVRPGQLYGASELGSVTLCDPASTLFVENSVGVPMAGVSIRILHPEDPAECLPVGREGQVAVRAPSMLSGYLDGPVPLVDGHFLTGDLGRLDEAGRLFITGRLKLVIDVGGLKVNPQEIEEALVAHPGIAECVVVPMAASDTITRLRAVFVARQGTSSPSEADLRAFLRARLSAHKIPRVFEAVSALPRSPNGKVLRARLADAPW